MYYPGLLRDGKCHQIKYLAESHLNTDYGIWTCTSLGFCLAHLSWKLKWAFQIAGRPSSVCPSVYKLFLFSTSFQEPLGQFQPNLAKSRVRGFKFVQMKCPALFQGGDNNEKAKIYWQTLKIFDSIISGLISTKLGPKLSWAKRIQIYSNEGPRPFSRGDNREKAKTHWRTFKIFFLRTTGSISTKLGTREIMFV